MISGVSSRLFQPYTITARPICDEVPESSPFLKLPDIPSRQYADLREDPDFDAIKRQFLSDIAEMGRLATGFVGDIYQDAIETFRNTINQPPENIESGLFAIFEETRHQIHKIVARMKALCSETPVSPADSTPERDRITLALHHCLNEIDHCPAGVQSRFSRACRTLETEPEQLHARLFLTRKTLLEEFCHTFLRQAIRDDVIDVQPGDEIHWVNALFNAVCKQFGLETIADPMAPCEIRWEILTRFRSKLPQFISEYTVLHALACDYYQRFCHFLDNRNLCHWRTETVPPGKLTSDHTDELEQAILIPLNQLCSVQDREKAIKLSTLIEDDGDQYSFARCREKIHGWLTRTVMEAPATLFARIPGPPDRPQRYIATYNNLFFWVFEAEYPLATDAVCPFDAEGVKPLTISDLSTIDVCSWPEPVQLALLGQAMEQTGVTCEDARNVSTFVLGKEPGKAVEHYPPNVQSAVAILLTEKTATSPAFAAWLVTELSQAFTESIPDWAFETPLLEPLLIALRNKRGDVSSTTDYLTIWQLLSFSPSSLKILFTPDECQELFQIALSRNLGGLMWRLLQTGHCDSMNNYVNPDTCSVLMVLCRQGVTDGVAYLVNTLQNTDINSKNSHNGSALLLAARHGQAECLGILLALDNIALNDKTSQGWTALHLAARCGHRKCLDKLLARDDTTPDVPNILNVKSNDHWTALMLAARYSHTECLKSLIARKNIALNEKNNNGLTALHMAAANDHRACLELLLTKGRIDPNAKSDKNWTALHYVARYGYPECLDKLLARDDIALNEQTTGGWTALHFAARYGHTECLDKLSARNGIDLNAKNSAGWTALQLTTRTGQTECLEILLARNGIDLDAANRAGLNVLHQVIVNNQTGFLDKLLARSDIDLNATNNFGLTAIMLAAELGRTECLGRLLARNDIDLNAKGCDDYTAFMLAAKHGRTECLDKLLARNDIDLNARNRDGWTALHLVAWLGHAECLGKLSTRNDIDINAITSDDYTALQLAAKHGRTGCLDKLLTRNDIDLNAKDRDGWTALLSVALHGHTESLDKLLTRNDIDLNAKTHDGWTALLLVSRYGHTDCLDRLLSQDNISLNEKTRQGWTTFQLTALLGHTECLTKLLARRGNIDLNEKNDIGMTALHYAAATGHTENLRILLEIPSVEINITNRQGLTPLMEAAENGRTGCVELLLSRDDTELNLTNQNGFDAYHLARSHQHRDIAAMLENDSRYASYSGWLNLCILL